MVTVDIFDGGPEKTLQTDVQMAVHAIREIHYAIFVCLEISQVSVNKKA